MSQLNANAPGFIPAAVRAKAEALAAIRAVSEARAKSLVTIRAYPKARDAVEDMLSAAGVAREVTKYQALPAIRANPEALAKARAASARVAISDRAKALAAIRAKARGDIRVNPEALAEAISAAEAFASAITEAISAAEALAAEAHAEALASEAREADEARSDAMERVHAWELVAVHIGRQSNPAYDPDVKIGMAYTAAINASGYAALLTKLKEEASRADPSRAAGYQIRLGDLTKSARHAAINAEVFADALSQAEARELSQKLAENA